MSQAEKHNCAGWTGRKYREIFQKIGKNTSGCSARQIHSRFFSDLSVLHWYFADISAILPIFPSINNRWRLSFRCRPISDISSKYRRYFPIFQSLKTTRVQCFMWWVYSIISSVFSKLWYTPISYHAKKLDTHAILR